MKTWLESGALLGQASSIISPQKDCFSWNSGRKKPSTDMTVRWSQKAGAILTKFLSCHSRWHSSHGDVVRRKPKTETTVGRMLLAQLCCLVCSPRHFVGKYAKTSLRRKNGWGAKPDKIDPASDDPFAPGRVPYYQRQYEDRRPWPFEFVVPAAIFWTGKRRGLKPQWQLKLTAEQQPAEATSESEPVAEARSTSHQLYSGSDATGRKKTSLCRCRN